MLSVQQSTSDVFRSRNRSPFNPASSSYYRARYYDPQSGRFLSEDPIHFRAGVNFYPYVYDNPVKFRDPSGKEVAGAVIGAVLGGIYGGFGAAADNNATGGDILAGIITGAGTGGIIGALDPTLGIVTVTFITAGGDAVGQLATGHGWQKCKPYNFGSTLGAAAGGALGAWGGGLFKGAVGWTGKAAVGALTGGPGALLPGIGGKLLEPTPPAGCGCGE